MQKNRPWAAGGERQKLWGPEGKTEGREAMRLAMVLGGGGSGRQLRSGNHGKRTCIIWKTKTIGASLIGLQGGES